MSNFSRNQFGSDLSGEKAVQKFFYKHSLGLPVFENLQKSSVDADYGGVDFTLVNPDIFGDSQVHQGDFKVALDYRKYGEERSLRTFAFEILGVDGKIPSDGWLFGEKYQADFYCVQWIWMNSKEKKKPWVKFDEDDIERLEYCIVSKQKILEIADKFNINKSTFHACIKRMKEFSEGPYTREGGEYIKLSEGSDSVRLLLRNDEKATILNLVPNGDSFSTPRLHLSKKKGERPINLLIGKEYLIENSLAHGVFDARLKIQIPPNSKYGDL